MKKKKKKTRLDKKQGGMKRKPQKVAPVAQASDDTGVCFWLISMENVSTTNALFGEREAESPDVQTQSEVSGFFMNSLVTRFPHVRLCFYIYIQLWCFICLTSSDLHFMAIFSFLRVVCSDEQIPLITSKVINNYSLIWVSLFVCLSFSNICSNISKRPGWIFMCVTKPLFRKDM